ncbi:MAG: hypothetical protein AAF690_01200 [Acidobacteriota bacterium]
MPASRPPRPLAAKDLARPSRKRAQQAIGKARAARAHRKRQQQTRHRIACIALPLFPLAARLRCEPELQREGVAIFEGNGQTARIVAASKVARKAGLKPGMTLPQARARLPKLVARARDPESERTAQEVLLEVIDRYSPRVENAGGGLAYLELRGIERHFASTLEAKEASTTQWSAEIEQNFGEHLLKALQQVGLPARLGIASSKMAARVAAGLPNSPTIVAPGEEALFLAPLPLHRLSPEAEVAETLKRWGIGSIGEFAKLPKNEVASRLGQLGQQLHTVARGIDPKPLIAREPPQTFREGMTLEWPIVNLEALLFVARTALERLVERLDRRGLGCRRLELSLQLEPDGFWERSIDLPSPTREVKTLLTLLRLDLEAHPAGAPVTGFALTAHPDAAKLAQLSLLGPASLSPDRLATTLARLFTLLGPGRVGSPRTQDGHSPERFRLVEYTPPPPPKVKERVDPGRGLLAVRVLRPAVEIDVVTNEERPQSSPPQQVGNEDAAALSLDRQPGLFRRAPARRPRPLEIRESEEPVETEGEGSKRKQLKIKGRIRVASGPWELEEQWWSESRVERDYWDVELQSGGLYRIYRDRLDGRWFADGIYD